ncbi:MAG TPA: hypothetical protein DCM05_17950 [Elusimicrobia bacterium]|nr:hypothetical protein [Elusimicrobiota bacterium]
MEDVVVVVFEAVNATLKEIYVGAALRPTSLEEIARKHRALLPQPVNHWHPDDAIAYRVVEEALPLRDRRDFIRSYAVQIAKDGWRVIAD